MAIAEVFAKLERWIDEQNAAARHESLLAIPACQFRIVGQTALLEAKLDLEIAATADVDVINDATYVVLAQFNELLKGEGLEYDQLSREIWMPAETKYVDVYRGIWVKAYRAEPEYVMVSKAKMAMAKNKVLIRRYIASGPPRGFFELCQKHGVRLNEILKG